MADLPSHIHDAYNEEFSALHGHLEQMGSLVESQFSLALSEITTPDKKKISQMSRDEKKLNAMEREAEALIVRMIALRQPMGRDLRDLVLGLRISSDFERIGDYAAHIVRRGQIISSSRLELDISESLERLAAPVRVMLAEITTAWKEQNEKKAHAILEQEEAVDKLYISLFRETLTYIMEHPKQITPLIQFLFIAKHIERIADLAVNIAEHIYHSVTGDIIHEGDLVKKKARKKEKK